MSAFASTNGFRWNGIKIVGEARSLTALREAKENARKKKKSRKHRPKPKESTPCTAQS